ncbi:unnamed protein product [Sphagnum jensenii]|uniref:Ferredoxin thioredoxin reductase alpha chain domain-containing protein n=1 Tax=Sphagnum jensenii TaxID=128206 RepID=A0ABP1C0D1_9BRYO
MASPVCVLHQQSFSLMTAIVSPSSSTGILPPQSKGYQLAAAISCPLSQTLLPCLPKCDLVQEVTALRRRCRASSPVQQRALLLRSCQASHVGEKFSASSSSCFNSSKVDVVRRPGQHVICETAVEVGEGALSSEGGHQKAEVGNRIRVKGPLIVYHVPKTPKFDIGGLEGEVKDVIFQHKGRPVSATFPYKVQFNIELEERKVKFFAHLRDDEFDIVENKHADPLE